MRAEQVERFTGIPYDEGAMDCADLVALVQRELFGRHVCMPSNRPRGIAGQAVMGAMSRVYAKPVSRPSDGDLVLMFDRGRPRPGHAGTYFHLAHEGWVLHTNSRLGLSVLHRARELADFGARIEGFYRWV
ncbi:peptidoglycan endopeptidase [Xanthomonas theicola]|uniref:NlpC/P60 domain-containing protein n=1 Tax=Xanthomonas theicola TaxID=56464 RepID=A0A2S6ZDR2_9XANT|nr:peptidoglycan endopeptidase [Xanthomonas theicola]PPT90415.1 hypothetical protein XthCFBP4691_12385 [Xanthomonas theicola]QNH24784.1 peptidoglycan endopeptidase [Xanthomonas theicola]